MPRFVSPLLLSLLLTGCSVVGIRSDTEQPNYVVVEQLDDDVEVRRYGPRVYAETVVEDDAGAEESRSAAFRILADYIFGANRGEDEIAMTAPVETRDRGDKIAMTAPVETAPADEGGGYAMRFFLPAGYSLESAPEPTDSRVRLGRLPEQTMAVLRFSGGRGEERVAEKKARLLARLETTSWRPTGEPVAYLYDPPWTIPFLRRNEVAVPVTKD